MRRSTPILLLLVLSALAVGLAGCGGGGSDSSGDDGAAETSGGSGGGTTLELVADPDGAFAYDKTALEASAGQITIDLANDSSLPHNVTIEGNGIEEVASETVTGEPTEVSADLEAGTYEFYCSVDGHREGGMEGTLTVG